MSRFDTCLNRMLRHEGGWSDRPVADDPGGPTNHGVTQATYDAFRRREGWPRQTVRAITSAEVRLIYREQYWDAVRGDELPPGLDFATFDYAVNSGPAQAARDLQRSVGAGVDGVVGMRTIAAARAAHAPDAINALCDRRLYLMQSLKNWRANRNGWTRRVAEVREAALTDAAGLQIDVTLADAPQPAADPADRSVGADVAAAARNPKLWAQIAAAASAVGGALSDLPEPAMWALAAVAVIGVAALTVSMLRSGRAA